MNSSLGFWGSWNNSRTETLVAFLLISLHLKDPKAWSTKQGTALRALTIQALQQCRLYEMWASPTGTACGTLTLLWSSWYKYPLSTCRWGRTWVLYLLWFPVRMCPASPQRPAPSSYQPKGTARERRWHWYRLPAKISIGIWRAEELRKDDRCCLRHAKIQCSWENL